MKGIKLVSVLKNAFKTPNSNDPLYKTVYFKSKPQISTNDTNIKEVLGLTSQQLLNKIGQWLSEGSSWVIESVDKHYLNANKYIPLKGSSYIQLPQELRNSVKGLINVKNEVNQCFRWCHIRHLNPQKSDKFFVKQLNYDGIEVPVTVQQYNKIEKQGHIRINVSGYENKQNFPVYVLKE